MIEAARTAGSAEMSLAPGGPPPDSARLALNYCRLGASNAQLAEFFSVSPETLGSWLTDNPEFAAAVRRGRKMADVEVVDGLHRLATGWVETVEKVMICHGAPIVVTYRRQHRPQYKAGITWLRNRMPQDWQMPGARREQEDAAVQAVDLFSLPLLFDESAPIDTAVGDECPFVEGVVDAADDVVARDERDDASSDLNRAPAIAQDVGRGGGASDLHLVIPAEIADCALGPPPRRGLAAAA